jgi:hypothetical protein
MKRIVRTTVSCRLRLALVAVAVAALAVPLGAFAGDQVPVRAADRGGWGVGDHACGALLPVFVETTGTGSQLGRYAYSARECVDLGAGTYAGSFTMTAANGDTLVGTYAGTFTVDGGGNILYEQTNTVTGGTGRFANASGAFGVSGFAGADGACLQTLSGAVSSVGSSKH